MRYRQWVGALLLASLTSACGGSYADAEAPMTAGMPGGGDYQREAAPAPPMDAMKVEEEAGERAYAQDELAKKAPSEGPVPAEPPQPGQQKPTSGGTVAVPGIDDPSRKAPILIYRAEFSLSVFEVEKSLDAVEGLAKMNGGYLSRRDDRSITVRVPAQQFQNLVDEIEKVGDVLHRDVVSEDVTAEYRDLEVQLQNQMALRARFEKLLEKAAKVQEALEIEKELGRITGEIERIKGRLKLLADQARYSTITVRFEPRASQQVQQGPFVLPLPWLQNVGLRRLKSL
ncbi:MAG: DUF4349 domain-containing protein [Polyangiaceae bacterium]|nr:DUF4349 domain-containing protein [Polyangiaceae bacterium]